MKALLVAAVLLIKTLFGQTQANKQAVGHSRFLQDFVEFYNIKHVCIIKNDQKLRILQTVAQLASSSHIYVSVVDAAGSQVHNATSSHITNSVARCEGLIMMQLQTQIDQAFFKMIFNGPQTKSRWLLLSDQTFREMLRPLYLPINNIITIANISPEGDTATLWEAYQITAHMDQKLTRVGLWTLRQDESTTPHEHHTRGDPNARTTTGEWALHSHPLRNGVLRGASSTIRGRKGMVRKSMRYGVLEAYLDDPIMGRTDLTGLHLRCTTIMYAPLTTVIERGDGSVLLAGFYGKILDTLQEWTNFTYTCHHVQDGQWGSKVDGEWNGMMKELLEGTADIAVSPLSITEVRSTAADFLYGLTTSSFKIIVRRPLNEDYMWTAYSKQFEIGVWGMIVFVVMILALSLFAVSYFSERVQISLADCVFAIIGIFLGKGVEQKTETGAGRTLILTALLAHVILLTFYTSNLVSALTVGPPLPPLKNLQDVYNDRSLRFGFLKGSSLTNMFDLPNPLFQAILREMKEEDFVDTPDEGMERVLGERYAFMEWELFYDLNYGSECGVFALPASYFPSYASLALTKGSPLVPVLNKIIMDILMAGLPTKWWLELKHAKEDCNLPQTSAIELKTMLTPFLVLGIGILVSFGFLCTEVLLRRDSSGGTLSAGE